MVEIEMVDIVSGDGDVIEVVSKTQAHERGLLHKTVISQLIDSSGRWVLVKQASDRQDAGQYVSPVGGHVQAGESEEAALRREAAEEVGLTGNFTFEYVGREIFNRFTRGRQENHVFIMFKIFSNIEPRLNEESVEYDYFTEEEIAKTLKEDPKKFGDAFVFVLQRFFPHLTQ